MLNSGGGTLCRSTFTGNISCPLSSLVTGSVGDKTCVSISCGNAACSGELSDNAGTCRVYGERPERELCIEGDAVWEGKSNTAASFVKMTGTHSMEIYLIHGFFLSLLKTAELPLFGSVDGIIICILNYFAALALSCCMIAILKYNKYLYGFCFFKKCK